MDLGDGTYVDGSWELSVLVDDLQLTRRLRVSGDTHVGGVMLRLVEAIDVRMDWSDHGLWWPGRNRWLVKTRHTLDQCGVQADARLEFHRMHGYARLQLPDLQELELRLSFAQSVFAVVVSVCRELGIRHPEELSLQADRDSFDCGGDGGSDSNNGSLLRPKNKNKKAATKQQKKPSTPSKSPQQQHSPLNNPLTPSRQPPAGAGPSASSSQSPRSLAASYGSLGGSLGDYIDSGSVLGLADSPRVDAATLRAGGGTRRRRRPPRTPAERAAVSGVEAWLDSSRSLMEQGLRPATAAAAQEPLRLRFKYHAHYDLNPQLDHVRINQLFEQVKWTVLTGEQQCTEEEALLLAALQLQARLGAPSEPASPPPPPALLLHQPTSTTSATTTAGADAQLDAEIDADIADLERSLMASSSSSAVDGGGGGGSADMLEKVPELTGWLKVSTSAGSSSSSSQSSPSLFATLRGAESAKRRFLVLRETRLMVYADEADAQLPAQQQQQPPVASVSLVGAEVLPDTSGGRLSIRLLPPAQQAATSTSAWWQLRCGDADAPASRRQFADWSAGLGLAARGRTLASRDLFAAEVRDTLARLELQRPTTSAQPSNGNDADADPAAAESLDPADYLPPAVLKRAGAGAGGKLRTGLVRRILERRAKVRERARLDAKLDYVRAWQRLPMSGVAYFCVHYSESQPQHAAIASFSEFRRERQQQQREELFGVAFNRICRLDGQTGEAVSTWRYHELDSWTVNWEVLSLSVSLNRPPHHMSLTPCPSSPALKQALCKTLAEYIGGYVFLSLRKPDKSQQLDEQLFHRLTCSRDLAAA